MPSYGRPEQCKKARESVLATAEGDVEVFIYVDEDDPLKDQYENYFSGPPLPSGKAIKYLANLSSQMFPKALMFMGADDMMWETKGWDRMFQEKMPEHGLSILVCSDGRHGTPPVFTKRFMEVTGLFPESFTHFGPDEWVVDTARRAGTLVFVPKVMVRHSKNKGTPTARRARDKFGGDGAKAYIRKHEKDRDALAAKIKALI